MHRSKSRARAVAKSRARRSSLSPAPHSPASAAPAAVAASGARAPFVADAMYVVDLLDAHLDRLHGVRSVLWAMSALLDRASHEVTFPRSVGYELQQLAKAGPGLAGDTVDALACDREAVAVR